MNEAEKVEYDSLYQFAWDNARRVEALERGIAAHLQAETPNWVTKQRCVCGVEFVSKCELHAHQAREYAALLTQHEEDE